MGDIDSQHLKKMRCLSVEFQFRRFTRRAAGFGVDLPGIGSERVEVSRRAGGEAVVVAHLHLRHHTLTLALNSAIHQLSKASVVHTLACFQQHFF